MTWLSRAIADGAVQVFEFDDASGTQATDKSGSNRHGTYVNTPTLGVAGLGPGETAASFARASSERVDLSTAGLPSGASPYAIELVFKPNSIDASQGLAKIGDTGSGNRANAVRLGGSAGNAEVHNYWWGNDLTVTGKKLYANQVYHLIAEWDGTTRRMFLNGSRIGAAAASGLNALLGTPTLGFTISAEYFDGTFYKAAVYPNALGPTKAREHYRDLVALTQGITDPREVPGLLTWYSADEISGVADGAAMTSWEDSSGNLGNTASVTGTPVYRATGGPNNGPYVEFDAPGDAFTLPDVFAGKTEGYILAGYWSTAAGNNVGGWSFGTDAQDSHLPFSNGLIYDDWGSANRKDNIAPHVDLNTWHQLSAWSKAGDWGMAQDRVDIFTTTSNTVAFSTTPKIGSAVSSAGGQIRLAYVVLLDHKPTPTERANLEAWFEANPSGGLAPDLPVVAAPSTPAALPLNDGAYLSWGAAPFSSSYEYRVNGGGTPVAVPTGQKVLVTGLTNGVSVNLEVRGVNSLGPGPWSSVVAVTPRPTLLYDDFERADSANLGSPVQGAAWAHTANVIGIASGKARSTSGEQWATVEVGTVEQDIETTMNNTNNASVIVRYVSATKFWMVQAEPGSSSLRIYERSGGSWITRGEAFRIAWAAGDKLRLAANGRHLYAYRNGVLVCQTADVVMDPAATKLGIRLDNTSIRLEDVIALPSALPQSGANVQSPVSLDAAPDTDMRVYKGRDTTALDTVGAS